MGAKKLKRGLIPALLLSVTLIGANVLVGCTADGEEEKENQADTEEVLEPEDENQPESKTEAGGNTAEPENQEGNGGETGEPGGTADTQPDDETETKGTPDVLETDTREEEPEQQGESTGEASIEFPQNRAGTGYFYSTGAGALITIHEIRENTVIFSLENMEESSYAGIDRGEAKIIDEDTVVYQDADHDLTLHWEPLSWGTEKFNEGETSTGAIHVSGTWPEECDLSSEWEYISRRDADIMEVS